jgi:hypothetical protein
MIGNIGSILPHYDYISEFPSHCICFPYLLIPYCLFVMAYDAAFVSSERLLGFACHGFCINACIIE